MKIANINGAKALLVEYEGKEYYLLFNGAAKFEIDERYGKDLSESLDKPGTEGMEVLGGICNILSIQGNLARVYVGLPETNIFDESLPLSPLMTPVKQLYLKTVCVDAMNLGYGREIGEEDEEIDLGLAELSKKKG